MNKQIKNTAGQVVIVTKCYYSLTWSEEWQDCRSEMSGLFHKGLCDFFFFSPADCSSVCLGELIGRLPPSEQRSDAVAWIRHSGRRNSHRWRVSPSPPLSASLSRGVERLLATLPLTVRLLAMNSMSHLMDVSPVTRTKMKRWFIWFRSAAAVAHKIAGLCRFLFLMTPSVRESSFRLWLDEWQVDGPWR